MNEEGANMIPGSQIVDFTLFDMQTDSKDRGSPLQRGGTCDAGGGR